MQRLSTRSRKASLMQACIAAAMCLAVAFALSLAASDAYAVTAAEKQAEAQATLATLNSLSAELDQKSNDYFEAKAEMEAAQAKMDEATARIEEANARIAYLQNHLGTRARAMYRTGASTMIDLLMGATSFSDFSTTWDLLNDMNESDAAYVEETKALRAEVEEQRAVYEEQERVAAEKTAEAERIMKEAEDLVAATQAIYDALSEEAAQLLAQEQAAQEAANARNAQKVVDGAGSHVTNPEPAPNPSGSYIVDNAYSKLGCSYVWAACGPDSFDCSGFVSYCIAGYPTRLGSSSTMAGWPAVSDPQPGDICVKSGHVGIYIGGGQMIHAKDEGSGVVISSVQSGMWFVRSPY